MFETFKEEMRNSLNEMEEETNKKLEEISKSLKENQEKEIKHMGLKNRNRNNKENTS